MKTPDDIVIHASLADATFRAYREAVIRLPPDVVGRTPVLSFD